MNPNFIPVHHFCCCLRCGQRGWQRPEGENHFEEGADISGGVCQTGELHGEPLTHASSLTHLLSGCLTHFLLV